MATLKKHSEDIDVFNNGETPKVLHRTLYFQHQQNRQKQKENVTVQEPANVPRKDTP